MDESRVGFGAAVSAAAIAKVEHDFGFKVKANG